MAVVYNPFNNLDTIRNVANSLNFIAENRWAGTVLHEIAERSFVFLNGCFCIKEAYEGLATVITNIDNLPNMGWKKVVAISVNVFHVILTGSVVVYYYTGWKSSLTLAKLSLAVPCVTSRLRQFGRDYFLNDEGYKYVEKENDFPDKLQEFRDVDGRINWIFTGIGCFYIASALLFPQIVRIQLICQSLFFT